MSIVLLLLSRHFFFLFKQKTAYEMRISDWSSDVCSSDLLPPVAARQHQNAPPPQGRGWGGGHRPCARRRDSTPDRSPGGEGLEIHRPPPYRPCNICPSSTRSAGVTAASPSATTASPTASRVSASGRSTMQCQHRAARSFSVSPPSARSEEH